MFTLKRNLILTLVLISSLSALAAEKAMPGKEPAQGTVGGAGGGSRGLKDTLPVSIGYDKPSSGITLQPPQLNDNPAATLVVETAGDPTVSLEVSAYNCKIDDKGLALSQSCERAFRGSTNSPIKILPGNYLITAEMNSRGSLTIYNEKPIQIRAGETRRLILKPVNITPTDRLIKAYIGVDYSSRDELKKYSAYHWATQSPTDLFAPIRVKCKANTYNGQCGDKDHLGVYLNKLANALCFGTDDDAYKIIEKTADDRIRYKNLYNSSEETGNALFEAFKSQPLLKTICRKNEFPEGIFAKTITSKGRDERINYYDPKTFSPPLYKIERQLTSINLTWDEKTKHVTLAIEQTQVDTAGGYYSLQTKVTQLSINRYRNSEASAYVFPGTYTVIYEFVGNWDNTEKTLTHTQYGQVVE